MGICGGSGESNCPCLTEVGLCQGNVTILPGGMSEDHRDSMIVNYTRTGALFFRTIRDEMRRVGGSTVQPLFCL